MEMIGKSLRIAAGAALLSAAIYLILAIPGFVSDRDSTSRSMTSRRPGDERAGTG